MTSCENASLLYRTGRSRAADAKRPGRKLQRQKARRVCERTLLRNVNHARELIAAWADDHNTQRPNSALGYQTLAGFALHLTRAIARRVR